MAISNIGSANQTQTADVISSSSATQATNRSRSNDGAQAATIVTISAQARRLNLAEGVQTQVAPQNKPVNPVANTAQASSGTGFSSAADAPSAPAKTNENRGSGINTYA